MITAAVLAAALRHARLLLALSGALHVGACTSLAGLKATGVAGEQAGEVASNEARDVSAHAGGVGGKPRTGTAGSAQDAADSGTGDGAVERGASAGAGTSGATSADRPATPDAGGGGGHTADSHDASAPGADAAPTAGGMASDALASVTCKPSGVREVYGSHLLIHCSTKLTLNGHSVEYLALPTQAAYGVSARTLQLATLAMLNDLELEVSVTPSGAGNSTGCALENCRTIRAFSITK